MSPVTAGWWVPTRKVPLRGLKVHRRDLIDPKIAEHRGRIVKTTGDGLLVEFTSV
jgi:class 3 adenylate cyclase